MPTDLPGKGHLPLQPLFKLGDNRSRVRSIVPKESLLMITKQELVYRQLVTLPDGARVLLRPLNPDDRQALIDLFEPVSMEDLRYMRHNVTDAEVVGKWVDDLDFDQVLPLVAIIGD